MPAYPPPLPYSPPALPLPLLPGQTIAPPSPSPYPPGLVAADAVAFDLTIGGAWSATARQALNAALAAVLGVYFSQVTTTASPSPPSSPYIRGDWDTLCAVADMITSEADCEAAATALSFSDTTAEGNYNAQTPHGCYHNDDDRLHFNTHSNGAPGAANANARPICAGLPPSATVKATVVGNNQTHLDWMADFVSCASESSCNFLTLLGAMLAQPGDVVVTDPSAYERIQAGTCAHGIFTESQCASLAISVSINGASAMPTCVATDCAPGGCYHFVSSNTALVNYKKVFWNSDKTGDCSSEKHCLCPAAPPASNWPAGNTLEVTGDATQVETAVAPPPSPLPPLAPGFGTIGAVQFLLSVDGEWSANAQQALNAGLAAVLGVDLTQVTTSASPPPPPLTVHVTIVPNNQTHYGWISNYVSCAHTSDSSCFFLTTLQAVLDQPGWPNGNDPSLYDIVQTGTCANGIYNEADCASIAVDVSIDGASYPTTCDGAD